MAAVIMADISSAMTNIISITSLEDLRIAPYRCLRERDLVGRDGLFIAEGEVVLRLLTKSPLMETLSVLVLEKRVKALAPILMLIPEDVPIYTASQEVMDAIAGFHIHRGILALGKQRFTPSADELLHALPPRALVLGLVGVSNHDNMGGIFRNAAAFGVSAVLVDASCCNPLYRKAIRVSVGAVLTVPFAKLRPEEHMLELINRHNIIPIALSPSGTISLSELSPPSRAALILGAEGHGLPDSILAACQSVSIPMAGGFDSLNVATASGIALHHLARAYQAPPISNPT